MRALLLESETGPSGLHLNEVDEPAAAEDTVLIEVHAAGVGFVDHLICRGEYQIRPPLPFVPGLEVAGVVRSAPAGSGFEEGMRVAAGTSFGGWAELAAAPVFLTMPLPDATSIDAGAGFVVNFQTAHLALTRRGRLKEGESVLVHGAAGGVGTACIQVARALGAGTIIGVATGRERMAVAMAAGADHALDAGGDWVTEARELTGGRGADVVCDPVGGDAFAQSLRCMAPEGRLLVIGFAAGSIPAVEANRLLLRHLEVVGVNWGGMLPLDPELPVRAARDLHRWLDKGYLRPVVGERYRLEDGASALEDFAARRVTGKPVLVMR
ncbi:MAG: NADPH:quinone reductase [Solirubrobacteraceae bacterium]|nr:NADPH:quinone reductase [Solirubrobacteraceae bacterium]